MELKITPEMEAQFVPIIDKYSNLANKLDKERFEWGLKRFYADAGETQKEVVYCPDPRTTIQTAAEAYAKFCKNDDVDAVKRELEDKGVFYTTWTRGRAAFADIADIVGIEIENKEAVETVRALSTHAALMVPFDEICFVSENAIYHNLEDKRLHSLTEPAWGWGEGLLNIYAIEGHFFPKHVITDPKSQTLEEINEESNEEKRRIRITRYGWEDYLLESNAKLLDTKVIKLESGVSWMENLMHLEGTDNRDDYTVLCTYDPSTGRPYALPVDSSCKTCADAQKYLVGFQHAFAGFPVKPDDSVIYPKFRT